MRSKKALLNFATNLLLEIITIVTGFILPQLLIKRYGSNAYGLTTSITQFLGYLTLLQSGVGGVVRAALYKPLAEKDKHALNRVIRSTEMFFGKIGYIAIGYALVLAFVMYFINNEFGMAYTASLVLVISVGTVFQYLFGITYQMLLQADQKSYIYSLLQMGCTVLNVAIVSAAVYFGASLHMAKLLSGVIYMLRPIIINVYVRRKYQIDRRAEPDMEVIAQRWNGFGQTLAYFFHTKTDVFLLTTFMTYATVSVYSVYALITAGLNTFISTISNAVQAAFGNMLALKQQDTVDRNFGAYLTLIHLLVSVMFSTAIVMGVPFVRVYTARFPDAGMYVEPIFGKLLLLAECMYCYRLPYHTIVIAAGHYKQTSRGAYIETAINIVVSVALLKLWGMAGVAVGTLAAMVFRTIDYVIYLRRNLIHRPADDFVRHMLVNCLMLGAALGFSLISDGWVLQGYLTWALYAFCVFAVLSFAGLAMTALIFRTDLRTMLGLVRRMLTRRAGK